MKVRFMFTEEVDLVEAPKGWHWAGTIVDHMQHVSLQQIATTIEPQAIGGIGIVDGDVSAGHAPAGGVYQWLGEFPDTRTASVALIKAMGLEVAP